MNSYYRILGLDEDADAAAIKKAYFKLIRKHTPEKDPDQFKKLREAYEYLQKEENVRNISKVQGIPREFQQAYFQVLAYMKKQDMENAIALCEEVLAIVEITEFEETIGKLYLKNENTGKAIKVWEALTRKYPDNKSYMTSLAEAYVERGWNKKARQLCEQILGNYEVADDFHFEYVYIRILSEQKFISEMTARVWKAVDMYQSQTDHKTEQTEWMADILWILIGDNEENQRMNMAEIAKRTLPLCVNCTQSNEERKLFSGDIALFILSCILDIVQDQNELIPVLEKYYEIVTKESVYMDDAQKRIYRSAAIKMEFLSLGRDDNIHKNIKNEAGFWYMKQQEEYVPEELREFADEPVLEEQILDRLLFWIENLTQIKDSLVVISKKYPILRESLGSYLDEMLSASNNYQLKKKYMTKYKKMMGYPVSAKLTLGGQEEMIHDSYMEGTYERTEKKIGRNDPCPCGSGKKYKKCCGK